MLHGEIVTKPNVLLIVADDMGYGDFGVFNDGYVYTPALDQLVSDGVCLTQHYSGSPVCSPARAALLTGRYPIRTGAITPQEVMGRDRIALREVTLADSFRHSGYATGLVGKWHNGSLDSRYHPNGRGFDEFAGFCGGWADYYAWNLDRNGVLEPSDGRYLTDVLTEEAGAFIKRHRSEPFFLSVMFNAPHSPLQAPEELVQPYLDAGLSHAVALTYAMIQSMDTGVARILEVLEKMGVADNTIVMFTSDNGPAFALREDQVPEGVGREPKRFNCGFKGAKGSVYEGGIRVPMILRWPDGLEGRRTIDELVHFTDWMPTLLSMTGAMRPGGLPLDGHDVLPLLHGEIPEECPRRFWQWNGNLPVGTANAAMREGPWKLVRPQLKIEFATEAGKRAAARYIELDIEYKYHPENVTELLPDSDFDRIIPDPPAPELYNIESDPSETQNLALSEPDRCSRMLSEIETWFEEVESERLEIQDVW
jgi:arylsulfatase A-like enzyme